MTPIADPVPLRAAGLRARQGRSQGTQLAYGTLLLLPWLVGIALVVQLPLHPYLQLPAISYAAGMWQGRVLLQLPAHRVKGSPRLPGRR